MWGKMWGKMGRLSAAAVKAAKEPGRYADGDGLYLMVHPGGSKSWVCRVQKEGKRRDFGLGSVKKVPLAAARERASKVRMQIEAGIDPIAVGDIQDLVRHLKARGIGVLVTDHNVRETLRITDRAYIVSDGVIFKTGSPAELAADEEVRRIYLGADFRMD